MKRADCCLEDMGCSMVVAVTQESVNAVLKEYLDNFSGGFENEAYAINADDQGNVFYEAVDYDSVKRTVGMDLYDISDNEAERTPEQKEAVRKAYEDMGFVLGFRFRIGLPEVKDVSALRDIVTFLESDITSIANVKYTMYLREFEIITITPVPRRGLVFKKLIQSPERPWYFTSRVKLAMSGVEFSELSKDLQDKMKPKDSGGNLKLDQVVSIQQLYMNLNTASLTDEFHLEGFSENEEIYKLFKNGFLSRYVKRCKENGEIILGYMAKQFPEPIGDPLVKPDDFNFCILPYYGEDGNADSDQQGMYTLNYVFSDKNEKSPDLKRYADQVRWNWIDASEKGDMHGMMIVDRQAILERLMDHFEESMKIILLQPELQTDVNLVKADYTYNLVRNKDEVPEFVYDSEEHKYKYEYNKSKRDHASYVNTVEMELNYKVGASMTFDMNYTKFIVHIESDGYLKIDGGVAKGKLYDTTLEYGVRFAVDQNGKLIIQPDSEFKETKGKTEVTSDCWIDFVTAGTGDDTLKAVKNFISDRADEYKRKAELSAVSAFSHIMCWVFPGGRVFTFKNPQYSKNGNVMVGITYVQPDDEEKQEK